MDSSPNSFIRGLAAAAMGWGDFITELLLPLLSGICRLRICRLNFGLIAEVSLDVFLRSLIRYLTGFSLYHWKPPVGIFKTPWIAFAFV